MDFAATLAAADAAALSHLGGRVVYAPRAGAPVEVKGIFDAAYQPADAGQAGMVSSGPIVTLALAELPTDPEDDDPLITIDGVVYRKRVAQKDGKGWVTIHLYLHEA